MDTAMLAIRVLLGLVFAFSSLTKLTNLSGFVQGVALFGVLPTRSVAPAAVTLVIGESIAAICLVTGFGFQLGIVLAVGLLLVFTLLMTHNATRSKPLPCYCFGVGDSMVAPRVVLVRLAFLLTIAALIVLSWVTVGTSEVAERPSPDALLLGLGGLIIGSWLTQLPILRAFRQTPVPRFANPGTRISLRNAPLNPLSDHGEEPVR